MIIKSIEQSIHQPSRIDVAWAKPVPGGFALYLYINGGWRPQVIMNDEGTDTPEDDEPYDLNGVGAKKLSDLEDVSLDTLTDGQILKYNGSSWENEDDDSSTPGPDTVGTEQIIDGAIEMQDLHDDVKGKIQKTYDISDESLSMDFDIQP
jgi:hypothetical protein